MRFGLLLAGLTLLTSAIHSAQAQPSPGGSERDVHARTLFEQGREAYSDGRYRDAWAYFHEAYQLSGRPELLFNIGQTADRLGQESDALKAFSLYLERLPAAANRKDVENRVRALHDRLSASQQAQNHPPLTAAPARPSPVQHVPAPTPAALAPARQPAPTPPAFARPREPRRGFILRAALGLGYRGDAISQSLDEGGFRPSSMTDYSLSGVGLALDLGVGWGVLPGFAIGGGLFLDWTSSPTLSRDSDGAEVELDSAQLTTIGPFLDWYPVRKTLGWYLLGSFGLSVLSYKGGGTQGDGYGFGVVLGTGYEWNLSTSIGFGVELRFLTSVLGEAVSGATTSHVITAPSLLASFTWF